ncbi:hypothetical protein ED388_12985 [Muribaculaceae bacterium Isolate-007 (NCI)]|jgi:hypothetical protein|nr:hypothetical protein EEL42_12200 [Muribaculaceae bacterium Isolate-100 (HZI)]RXE64037.1 hypothetical protein ED388_12985 [Muribaculaceae bacterium Isolate-007 (NCI)]
MDKFIYSAIASELNDIKNLHGKPRREALQRLDNIVTRLFPPVEGSPLPSEELNGVADVMPLPTPSGASATYWCGPLPFGKY